MNVIENLYIQQSEVDHFKTMNQRYIGKMQEQQDQIAELKNQLACCREENKGLVESLSKSQIRISECLSLSKSWSETEFKKTTHWSEGYEAACGNCSIELDQVLRGEYAN